VNGRPATPDTKHMSVELGASQADFRRLFPHVVAPQVIHYQGLRTSVGWPDGALLEVELSPEKTRKIGSLRLTYLDVAFSFTGFDSDRVDEFMRRFRLTFHKGGG